MFQDVGVTIQVRFIPEFGRQRLETYFFPMDHHQCFKTFTSKFDYFSFLSFDVNISRHPMELHIFKGSRLKIILYLFHRHSMLKFNKNPLERKTLSKYRYVEEVDIKVLV